MTLLYVAGPMTGLPDFNFPAFAEATAQLRAAGYSVESPAEAGQVDGFTWNQYMRRGLLQMLRCDGVAVLPGWEGSRGAGIECRLARDLAMPVRSVQDWRALAGQTTTV